MPPQGKKSFKTGNLILLIGLVIFMTMFTIVSVMGNIPSESIDKPAGIVFIISALMIIAGLFM
jgi:hypothetical protein